MKIGCIEIRDAVSAISNFDSRGGTIVVTAFDTNGKSRTAATLYVPPDAVQTDTKFVVHVPRGSRAAASVKASVKTSQGDDSTITGPFEAGGLELTISYDRKCKLGNIDADNVDHLVGFRVPDSQEDAEDPDAVVDKGGKKKGKSITITLQSLSGYILAQGRQPPNPIIPDSTPPNPPRDSSGLASPDTTSHRVP